MTTLCKQTGITELTPTVVAEFIKEVRVYDADRVEVVFNYADEYAKIEGVLQSAEKERGKS